MRIFGWVRSLTYGVWVTNIKLSSGKRWDNRKLKVKKMDLDDKIELYIKQAKEFFPEIAFRSSSSFFNPEAEDKPKSGKVELRGSFLNKAALKNGPVEFIHYTNLTSAMNILNTGVVRLYNCLNLNDPSEINYLLDQSPIKFDDKEIEKYKREHFILSGSIFKSEVDEDYNMWRLYGDAGNGIGIVFEIDDKIDNWRNVYLQNISYGKINNDTSKFLKFHAEFDEKYKLFQNKPDILSLLSTGVKNEIWSIEKEFRVVIRTPFNKDSLQATDTNLSSNSLIYETLKHELKPNGKMVSFVELPLSLSKYNSETVEMPLTKRVVNTQDYVPNLKIKKIILGPNGPFQNLSDFRRYHHSISSKMRYEFEVYESSINLWKKIKVLNSIKPEFAEKIFEGTKPFYLYPLEY